MSIRLSAFVKKKKSPVCNGLNQMVQFSNKDFFKKTKEGG